MHRTHLPHRCSAAVWTSRQAPWASRACRAQASARQHSGQSTVCSAAVSTGPKLNLQVAECSIVFPFTHDTAEQLSQAMTQLLQTFSEKQKAERPKRWPMMEFRCQDEQHGIELLEVYCNPNAHSTAFDAKTLITLKTSQGVRVTAEARLSALKSDLDTFLEPK